MFIYQLFKIISVKVKKNLNKKGQGIGAWKTTALYILLAIVFLLIIYIIFKVIIKRIKDIYF